MGFRGPALAFVARGRSWAVVGREWCGSGDGGGSGGSGGSGDGGCAGDGS